MLDAIATLVGKQVQVQCFFLDKGPMMLKNMTLEAADRCFIRLRGQDGKTIVLPHQVLLHIASQLEVDIAAPPLVMA